MTGAGDTVIATLGVMLASGAALERAVRLANRAAGIVVGKFGTAVVQPEELFGEGREHDVYYVVTGAAGFIGSNLVRALNDRGVTDIIAVDNLTDGDKFANLADCEIADYLDKDEFLDVLEDGELDGAIDAVLHQGACSDTTERDGRYMMQNNYEYSKRAARVLHGRRSAATSTRRRRRCTARARASARTPSPRRRSTSTATRSSSSTSSCGARAGERTAQVVGLRYFNVYGAAREPQGAHGLGRLSLLQPVPRRRAA